MDQLRADDGMSRLARQRRATRLDTWIDDEGMWCLRGRFDPETGLTLHSRLANTVAALFADKTPDDCPFHPLERQAFLRAHALAALTEGHGTRSAVPEIVAVVDLTDPQPDGSPTVDWGLPVELPAEVLRRLFDTADIHPIIVRGGVVLHAPGCLDLGRTTRVANRAQRRALRALYPPAPSPAATPATTCASSTTSSGGNTAARTDLANLLPLCVRHHHAVHDHGWHLILAADRSLTITYPDGTSRDHTRRRHDDAGHHPWPSTASPTPMPTAGRPLLPCGHEHLDRAVRSASSTTALCPGAHVRAADAPACVRVDDLCSAWPGSTALPAGHSTATLTWRPMGTISGVPETGSSMTRQARSKTSRTSSSVTTSAGGPSATNAPPFMATRWWA